MKPWILAACFSLLLGGGLSAQGTHFLDEQQIAAREYTNDSTWYLRNIPFFSCSDTTLEQVYYYRWKLYKAHLKDLGAKGFIVTEFLNQMSWDRKPYNSLNDATPYHIYEGRWLKDHQYMDDYIRFMYLDGGNDRHFSEAIADAAYGNQLVNPDKTFITALLPEMERIYNAWDDHYDSSKGLYYIEPLLDATEYTIASIDASGGKDGFTGGDAFRPSINSFMYANALAIAHIADLKGDASTARLYRKRAAELRKNVETDLWNDSLRHFIDRYKVSNRYVSYWHFIRGRELVGYEPWAFNLPDHRPRFNSAWSHLLDTADFLGKYGLRTVEPSYQYYMKQYRYDRATGQRECQWNGPSWPFQTCMVLRGLANLLNNYQQHVINKDDYVFLLQQYARQHYWDGHLDLVEDYDPDKGGPIVDLPQRSEHYNHSEFNDLLITGLCGVRPASGNRLVIDPLIDPSSKARAAVHSFCLENLSYHGHLLTILYDASGRKYGQGAGLSVFVDGKRALGPVPLDSHVITLAPAPQSATPTATRDLAVNLTGKGYPKAAASYTDSTGNAYQAIDGRLWYFQNVRNRWSTYGSPNQGDWYMLSFAKPVKMDSIRVYFYGDGRRYAAPESYHALYWDGDSWKDVQPLVQRPGVPEANGPNSLTFKSVNSSRIKVWFTQPGRGRYTAVAELKVY